MARYPATPVPKDPALQAAEQEAAARLRAFCRREIGIQAQLARDTGIHAPVMSRMSRNKTAISLEQAIRIELASNGELPAEMLCPSRQELLQRYVDMRATRLAA